MQIKERSQIHQKRICFKRERERENIDKYKVFFAKAHGSAYGEKYSEVLVGVPGQICTETFLRMGSFDKEKDAYSLKKYFYTKFFRSLFGILKATQNVNKSVLRFIPLQDFTPNSDIDWTKSVSEIDKQLYKKYDLTQEEINFIESKVQPMG